MPRQKYPGKKRTYTPEQTDRYLSQRNRWLKSQAIAPTRIELVSKNTAKEGCALVTTRQYIHIYQSSRNGLEWKIPVTEVQTCVALDCVLSP
jgi:hypothetical protein